MNPAFRLDDDDDRPSRLTLDRFAAGELKGEDRARVQAWLSKDTSRLAHLDDLRKARPAMRPFDAAAIRARAAAIEQVEGPLPVAVVAPVAVAVAVPEDANQDVVVHADVVVREDVVAHEDAHVSENVPVNAPAVDVATEPQPVAWQTSTVAVQPAMKPANRPWWQWVAPLAVAAALVLAVTQLAPHGPDVRIKGKPGLHLYHLEPAGLTPYAGEALGAGDVVGFKVAPGDHRAVVVLSVDGTGAVSVYASNGDAGEPVGQGTDVSLPGSVTLDGAPGPEVFVAVFDADVPHARDAIGNAWRSGGPSAVIAWAQAQPDADAVSVTRK